MSANKTDLFFDFERRHSLFDLKDSQGIYYWDIVRYSVFSAYTHEAAPDAREERTSLSLSKLLHAASGLARFCWTIQTKRFDRIFFICSRTLNPEGKRYDQVSNDLVEDFGKKSLLIETYVGSADTIYENAHANFCPLYCRLTRRRNKHKDDYNLLSGMIRAELSIEVPAARIAGMVDRFVAEDRFYTKLFRKARPKAVFFVQNGIQKGMSAAAARQNIPLVEIQHGIVSRAHGAYSYDEAVLPGDPRIHLPRYIFRLGDYWFSNIHCPVRGVVTIGNSFMGRRRGQEPTGAALTVVSADVYGENLSALTRSLAVQNPGIRIFYKLHPNEYVAEERYLRFFDGLPNVTVVAGQKTMAELLDLSRGVLLIHSTVAYEALDRGLAVFIFKRQLYYDHSDIFTYSNVFLLDTEKDIMGHWNTASASPDPKRAFFAPYNRLAAETFLSKTLPSEV